MTTTRQYIRRELSEVNPWTETCGLIRPLIEERDHAPGEVHYLEITDAKLHYHERTDEFYYILSGQGRMILDDVEVELHEGVVVYVPRGTKHRAWGDLSVLVVCIPNGVLHDVHEVEGSN
jgi:mannose-6-phosphate isomerase-like protein (cupin superfamily)